MDIPREPELEQLIQKRQNLIRAHQENDFTDGIHALLTDLYPDTAHFIYELLQNAEDMNATVVRFVLRKDGIVFVHNGTKRSFNVADIDAIANIGHNGQKKDDPTSIGKFGVGFKAVFAYTSTPIIHSGKYHFKIKDYFVPDFKGIKEVNTTDENGVAWTKFSFPFNNPKKPANDAYEECFDGLKELNSSSILFLQNIRRIEYRLPYGGYGYVERQEQEDHHVKVIYHRPNEMKISESSWLRFHRFVQITDDQGKLKNLSIAAAFALDYDEKTKREKIVPVKGGGRTFIYFPAEKEHSGLRFHINAPFASTVARDSVRDCDDNKKLIKAISQLIVDSLPEIKAQGLMNHAFFEVLPNDKDSLSFFYQYVFDYVYAAFQKNEYLPTKNGRFAAATTALMGPAAVSNLLQENDIKALTGIEKIWIKNAVQRNSYADNFIQSLDIQKYSYMDFANIFDAQYRSYVEALLSQKDIGWLKRFYVLCADAYNDMSYRDCDVFVRNMKRTLMIKSNKRTHGAMYLPTDIYILPKNTALLTKTTPIVNQDCIVSKDKNDRISSKVKDFFEDVLDIHEYGPKVEIEKILKKYNDVYEPNEEYFNDLLTFAKYEKDHNDIDFSARALFLYLNNTDDELYITTANEVFLGQAYGNTAGELLSEVYDKHCLWDGYVAAYDEKEMQQFIAFAISCGARKGLSLEKQSAWRNPLYYSKLDSGRRYTGYGTNEDYTIPELEGLLQIQSIEISKQIWETLEQHGKIYGRRYVQARYAPNASVSAKTCDSSLIYYLKQYAWIPDKQGNLYKPTEISVDQLRNDFFYNEKNEIFAALGFGSAAEKENQKRAALERDARELGMRMVPNEEYEQYLEWCSRRKSPKDTDPMSGQELFERQKKNSAFKSSLMDLMDDSFNRGAVSDVPWEETNIEETFHNAKKMKPQRKKLFSCIAESTEQERRMLQIWYHGNCQMCNIHIMKYDHTPYFIAKNIINTQTLSAAIRQTTYIAWNSLCLCPNCAAKYEVCSKNLDGLYGQILATEVIEGDARRIVLTIELADKIQEIHYEPEHFLALKKVIQLIDEENLK